MTDRSGALPSILSYAWDPQVRRDPYPAYDELRRLAPLYLSDDDVYYVSRYSDLVTLYRSGALSYDPVNSRRLQRQIDRNPDKAGEARNHLDRFRMLLEMDPPDHTRVRLLLGKAFTPQLVGALEGFVDTLVDRLLEPFEDPGPHDFVAGFAFLLPVFVICHLLGVSADQRGEFAALVEAHLPTLDPAVPIEEKIGPQARLLDYIEGLVAERAAHPGNDVVSMLIEASEDGDRLSKREVVANTMALLVAGFETTQNLLGNGVLALLRHPEQLDHLQGDAATVAAVVEEVLRFDPPIPMVRPRSMVTDLELSAGTLRAGDAVMPVFAAANRDPEAFVEPDRFDVDRSPNHHLAFGHGPHFCLGRSLARLEAAVAWPRIFRRFPALELAVDDDALDYKPNVLLRSLVSLPVTT